VSDIDQMLAAQAAGTGGMQGDSLDAMLASRAAAPDAPAALKVGATVNADLNSIPRQLGLAARYGLEGLANTAQIVTEPIRAVTDRLFGQTGKTVPLGALASQLADKAGLPTPQTPNERVVGDATRLVAGAGGLGSAAQAASALPGTVGKVGAFLSSNMPQQLSSAAGAGLLGGASREAGAPAGTQAAASLIGGVAGGMVPGTLNSGVSAVRNMVSRPDPQQLDQRINVILQRANIDWSQIPQAAQNSLRQDIGAALSTGGDLNADAVRRLVDFRSVGATPTRGAITQDPVQITREMNLAKTTANTADGDLHGLPRIQNQNNAALIQRLNDVGGAAEMQPVVAGRTVAASVLGQQQALRSAEQQAWGAARSSPSYTQPIYPDALNNINRSLGDEGMMGFMNPTISRYMEAFQTGQQPFTPQAYRNLQSMLSNELAKGGNEAHAARIARNALESTPIQPINNPRGIDFGNLPVTGQTAAAMRAADAQPGNAVDAINQARAATRAAYAYEDSSPLVRSVLSDGASGDPTRIAQRFIIGGTPDEAATVAQQVGPAGRAVIKNALATYIKKQALSGANDEVGKVSQSALNSVLRNIGDEKLRLFFSPEELNQLRSASRVASYVQVQPVGSAVNNSNTGALLMGRGYDALKALAGKIPGGESLILNPLKNIEISMHNRQAQNVIPGLLTPQPRPPIGQGLLLPAAAVGGLLSAP
jgi:hypothetical protein